MTKILFAFLVTLIPVPAFADSQNPVPTLGGTDLYGSSRLTIEEIQQRYGKLLQRCIDESLHDNQQAFEADREAFGNALTGDYRLSFAKLTIIKYFNLHNVPGRPAFATVDVVEKSDAARRMAFTARPTQHFQDPGGLLKSWDEYQKIGFDLMNKGEISGQRVDCPAFHCIFGHEHPRLAPFRDTFVNGATKYKRELEEIFLNERDDQNRSNAAFVLAYTKDGSELIEMLSRRVTDESELVRNNVIRVFSDIAQFHRDLALPVEKIIPILDYPETTDRNKASAVIWGLVSDPTQLQRYKALVMDKAVPVFLKTLRIQQPNNHDFAYMILRALSGKDFGERDYAAWENWYAQTKKAR